MRDRQWWLDLAALVVIAVFVGIGIYGTVRWIIEG